MKIEIQIKFSESEFQHLQITENNEWLGQTMLATERKRISGPSPQASPMVIPISTLMRPP